MKIVDHAGNSLKAGRLLRWQHNATQSGPVDYYVKVVDVVAPTKDMPGKVEFTVTFGIPPQAKEQGVIQFKDFVTVFDPEEEIRAEATLARVTGPQPLSLEMAKGAS